MKLIKDLGMRSIGHKGKKARYGLYECPVCHKHFECRVGDVKSGNTTKCRSCSSKVAAAARTRVTTTDFIEKAKAIHGNLYEYPLVDYVNVYTKVKITCPIHGIFEQVPHDHLNGRGCPQCAITKRATLSIAVASESFIDKATAVHDNYYNYTMVDYNDNKTKVKIICPTHGVFEQTPANHLNGSGCSQCAINGFNGGKPAIVYYLKVFHNNVVAYKIGITNRSVKERFSNEDLDKITIIKTWDYLIGAEAYKHEQMILKQYKDYKYTGEPLLSSGNTELFTIDILELDKEIL